MLKDFMGCLVHPMSSEGNMLAPKNKETKEQIIPMFVDQNLYVPPSATLFEAITLKPIESYSKEDLEKTKS